MREVKDPVRRGKWLYKKASDEPNKRVGRMWGFHLLDHLMHYRMGAGDIELDWLTLATLLWDLGLPSFDEYQQQWEIYDEFRQS